MSLWERLIAKAFRDRSKLVQRVVIDKNGHRKTVWVKTGKIKVNETHKELNAKIVPIDTYLNKYGIAEGAEEYLKTHYRGFIKDGEGEKVLFSKNGNKKILFDITREKARLLPYMKEVVQKGETSIEPLVKQRRDYKEFKVYSHIIIRFNPSSRDFFSVLLIVAGKDFLVYD